MRRPSRADGPGGVNEDADAGLRAKAGQTADQAPHGMRREILCGLQMQRDHRLLGLGPAGDGGQGQAGLAGEVIDGPFEIGGQPVRGVDLAEDGGGFGQGGKTLAGTGW